MKEKVFAKAIFILIQMFFDSKFAFLYKYHLARNYLERIVDSMKKKKSVLIKVL